jgi:CubicO group peptidase (beta-lactamase class C family)
MTDWLHAALDYCPQWLDFQRVQLDQPGVSLAVAYKGEIVLAHASGVANLDTGEALTPRHRFRVASHSKTFTAASIMLLREQGKLRLDDPVGRFVDRLTPEVATVTIGQLLSHTAGLTRDGVDSGQFMDRKPFLSEAEYREDLQKPQPLASGVLFKYSNHGFALLGKVIQEIVGEPYGNWVKQHVVDAAGLTDTTPDFTNPSKPFARGHTTRIPHGRRFVISADNPTNDMASATGFTSTASDLARFFAQLSPRATKSFLTAESRREMTRRHWRDANSVIERYYGLGTMSGPMGPWAWTGHGGAFQGTLSRTVVLPEQDISVSVISNAIDGAGPLWLDGITHILETINKNGAPTRATQNWCGRWWSMWGAFDLVPGREKVMVAVPSQGMPFLDASELAPQSEDVGIVSKAQAYGDHGETCRLVRGADGGIKEVRIGGKRLVEEAAIMIEARQRYGAPVAT